MATLHLSQQSVSGAFGPTLVKGIFAGWLIALMVWLLPAAESTRLQVIIILTYLVGLGQFAHIIAGSVDAFYLVNLGKLTWLACIGSFIIPTLIGNIIGGVSLVAVLNMPREPQRQWEMGNPGKKLLLHLDDPCSYLPFPRPPERMTKKTIEWPGC